MTCARSGAPALLQAAAAFVEDFSLDHVPVDVLDKARATLLHNLAVALAGYTPDEPAARLARLWSSSREGVGARLLVDGDIVSVDAATVATSAVMHARTQDDSQFSAQMHLGCTVLPPILALGDRDDWSGHDFLEAMIVGYEVATAIGHGPSRVATERGFRATSLYGGFGAAAAVAKLMGLGREQIVSALALSGSFGGGINQTWVSGGGEWQYQPGVAARNGLTGAMLAAEGVGGSVDALEGQNGFYRAFSGEVPELSAITNLGTRWNLRDVTFKLHPVCAINQTPVDLARRLKTEHGVRIDDIDSISLHMVPVHAAYPGTDARGPFSSPSEALMSAQFSVAVALSRGGVRVGDLDTPLTGAEQRLADNIEVIPDPSHPEHSVTLIARVGDRSITVAHDATTTPPQWGADQASSLLEELVPELPIDQEQAAELRDRCQSLESGDVRGLISATLARRP